MDEDKSRIPKLRDAEDWVRWKFTLRNLLDADDAYEVVDGSLVKPTEPEPESGAAVQRQYTADLKAWRLADKKARKLIVTTVDEKPMQYLMTCESAFEMWNKLLAVYEQKSEASLLLILCQFYNYKKDPSDDMATHISRLERFRERLKQMGEKISDVNFMARIISTLPDTYTHFASAWDSTPDDKRTVENLTSRLMMEEARFKARDSESNDSVALLAKGSTKRDTSFQKNKTETKQPDKPNKGRKIRCYKCHKLGHIKRDCKSKGTPDKGNKQPSEEGDAFVGEVALGNSVDCNHKWYADSGASHHMSHRREWFVNFDVYKDPKKILIGKGMLYAHGQGNIEIEAYADGKWTKRFLENVLYVPDMGRNLFSLGSALDHGLVESANNEEMLFFRDGLKVAVGIRDGKLYRMLFRVLEPEAALVSTTKETLRLWHERLGHQNYKHVQSILKRQGIEADTKVETCEGCMYGKQHRKSFGRCQDRAKAIGELIHADVCGPMEESSLKGSKYFVLFKDDLSHFRMVYFLKEKSEVKEKVKSCVAYIKRTTGNDVKILRTDNGKEFVNKDVTNFLEQNGIVHQRSVSYTPEQNGSAEREMRTVVELARSMLHAKGLEKQFWAEATHTAVYVLNRTGTSSVTEKTPFELWHGKQANIGHLRVFGTSVFVHIPKEKRRKWDAKSERGIFVGYGENQKGYRVYFPQNKTVQVVRDVEFVNESYFTVSLSTTEQAAFLDTEKVLQSKNPTHEEKQINDKEDAKSDSESVGHKYFMRDRGAIRKPERFSNSEEVLLYFAEYNEPTTYEEAMNSELSEEWKSAMDDEMTSLNKNETWVLTDLPEDQVTIGNRWVYRIKHRKNGEIDRFKARLVVKGFAQRCGIDYHETFSPVVKLDSVRAILGIAATEGLALAQFDIKTAFLYGKLEETIYMDQPKGYEDGTSRVCKLQRSLYGLKQSPRCWNQRFTNFLQKNKLSACDADPCVFVRIETNKKLIVAIHVDDGLMAATIQTDIDELMHIIKTEFDVRDGNIDCFVGLEIEKLEDGSIFICQMNYAKRVLERFQMSNAKALSTPMDPNVILDDQRQQERAGGNNVPFREAIGSLMYLAIGTRPDLMFAVSRLSQYLSCYTEVHWKAVKRIFRYLKGSTALGIRYISENAQETSLTGYSDADFAGDIETRKSTSGYIFTYAGGSVTWGSRKQTITALSTMEAEYVAASEAVRELLWLKHLYGELTSLEDCPVLKVDNQSAIKFAQNQILHRRSKHIAIKYHFVREALLNREMVFKYIETNQQVADLLTKALSKAKFEYLRRQMGLTDITNSVQ